MVHLKIPPWNRRNNYKPPIFGFHVSFRGIIPGRSDTWLITMGLRVRHLRMGVMGPLPNGRPFYGLSLGVILTTYDTWDDPPSMGDVDVCH